MNESWLSAVALADVPAGTMTCLAIGGRRVLIAHTAGGAVLAADEMCTHEDASLCLGALVGERVKCPLHGSWFDLRDGAVTDEPATEALTIHPARVVDGVVEVCL